MPTARIGTARRWAALEAALIVGLFAIEAGWPPPDVNEPHYLAKARHFWDPGWIQGDFFLDSDDTHLVFYVTCGWLAKLLPLPAASWCGRFAAWTLLAAGWWRLSRAIVPRPGWAVFSAACFVILSHWTTMAGEWAIGGFEAKPIAYGLVLLALGEVVRAKWNVAWILLGAASAMHVLVGGWTAIAAAGAWFAAARRRPSLRSMLPGLVIGGLLALPGLVPALLLARGATPEIAAEANRIYVFERLPHHLWPGAFPVLSIERHALAFCVWVALWIFARPSAAMASVERVVAIALVESALGLALAGLLAAEPSLAAGVLRFYWFRLGDVMLPVGLALLITGTMKDWLETREASRRLVPAALAALLACYYAPLALDHLRPQIPPADARGKVIDHADWEAACAWAREHTPAAARFLTPRSAGSFRWYAQRAEVVSWKDIPQKADQIVAWWRRINEVHGTGWAPPERQFFRSLAEEGEARLVRLGQALDAAYVLTSCDPPLVLPLVYKNNSYAIYRTDHASD